MKTWQYISFFLFGGMCALAPTLQAQNNEWCVVMAEGNYAQQYSAVGTEFPAKFIDDKWKAGEYITDLVYSPEGWRVVMSSAPYTFQRWKRQRDFPTDFIETGWRENLDITKVAYGNGEWAVVMSKNAGLQSAIWAKRSSLAEIETWIKANWSKKDIISLAYGNGDWVAVMANGVEYDKQLYLHKAEFPEDWVQANYDKGYNITTLTYGEGMWFVVMSMLPEQRNETFYLLETFPFENIKEEWNGDPQKRIISLHYNYEKSEKSYTEDYMALGSEALNAGNYDEAIKDFTEAIRIDASNALAYNNRAWAKFKAGQCQGGLTDANQAVKMDGNEFALHTRASIYSCLGRCTEALTDFDKAVSIAKNKEAFYYGDRAKTQVCLGDYDKALADYNKALELDPSNSEYKTAKVDVDKKLKTKTPPTITWDYPYNAFTASTKGTYEIKACIHASGASLKKVQVMLNGKDVSMSSRGFDIDEDCDGNVDQNISLVAGKNELQIIVTTDQQTATSEKRTIEFQSTSSGNYHAVLIGVSNYDDMAIKDLESPANDIVKLKETLTSKYTFNPNDVHLLASPTKDEILNKLVYLQERLGEKDNLLVFYAGHGIVKNEVGYWLPSNAQKENRSNWLSNAELRDYVNGMKSKHVLVIADACFSGSIITGSYRDITDFACEEMAKIPSRRAMTSGANTVVPDQSVFLEYLLKKLNENTNSCFTAEDLYSKIKPAVIGNSPNQQIPQFGVLPQAGDEGGNFIFKKK